MIEKQSVVKELNPSQLWLGGCCISFAGTLSYQYR